MIIIIIIIVIIIERGEGKRKREKKQQVAVAGCLERGVGQQPGQAGHVGGWDMDMGGGRGVHMEVPPGDSPGQEEPNPRVGK